MIKFKEEGIPLWEYQVRRVEDNVFRIGSELDDWGMRGYECFCVTNDKDNQKTLYFKKPRE